MCYQIFDNAKKNEFALSIYRNEGKYFWNSKQYFADENDKWHCISPSVYCIKTKSGILQQWIIRIVGNHVGK